MFVESKPYQSTINGCYYYHEKFEKDLNLPFSIYYISSFIAIACEVVFIALLLYPLLSLWNKINRNNVKNKKSPSDITSSSSKSINFQSNNTNSDLTTAPNSCQTVSEMSAKTTKVCAESVERESQQTDSFKASKQQILQVVRRNIVCSSLCFISDLIALAVLSIVIKSTLPRYFAGTIYDIIMVLKFFLFLRSFENYKEIVCFIFFEKLCGSK